jgi:hypothetical protein
MTDEAWFIEETGDIFFKVELPAGAPMSYGLRVVRVGDADYERLKAIATAVKAENPPAHPDQATADRAQET